VLDLQPGVHLQEEVLVAGQQHLDGACVDVPRGACGVHADPAYEYAEGLRYELTIDGKTTRRHIGKRDQFAPELLYFSECILHNREPEPTGEEGQQDVRIVQALYESANTGKTVDIPPFRPSKRPSGRQRIKRPGISKPSLVKVKSASRD